MVKILDVAESAEILMVLLESTTYLCAEDVSEKTLLNLVLSSIDKFE
jgi:hypothetical protein